MEIQDLYRKKYRLSLLNLVKGMLKAAIIGAIVAVVLVIIIELVFSKEFNISDLAIKLIGNLIEGAIFGILVGCVLGVRNADIEHIEDADDGEVQLYNMYVSIHNGFVFGSIGSGAGCAVSMFVLAFQLLLLVYQLVSIVAIVPISVVYLCAMALFETIFNGIPVGLGNALDKLPVLLGKFCGILVAALGVILLSAR